MRKENEKLTEKAAAGNRDAGSRMICMTSYASGNGQIHFCKAEVDFRIVDIKNPGPVK
jgi:hypothetical protein